MRGCFEVDLRGLALALLNVQARPCRAED